MMQKKPSNTYKVCTFHVEGFGKEIQTQNIQWNNWVLALYTTDTT